MSTRSFLVPDLICGQSSPRNEIIFDGKGKPWDSLFVNKKPTNPKTQSMIYSFRYCTGGCAAGAHRAHIYAIDPVDGPLLVAKLCPGNLGEVREVIDEEGEPTGEGFIF
jgi:hypothetical protein